VVVDDGNARAEAAVTVTVTPVNDPPVASPTTLAGSEDAPATTTLSATDADGDALSWELKTAPGHGTATVDARSGAVTFVPEANWYGSTGLTVRVGDGRATTDVAVAVAVAPVNDAPALPPARLSLAEDTTATVVLEARDVDGDSLTFSVSSPPTSGTAAVDARGRLTYRPAPDHHGSDRFSVAVSDGVTTVEGAVAVTVEPVNDPPTLDRTPLAGSEDAELTATLAATDVDGDTLRFVAVGAPNAGGKFALSSAGVVRWTPPPNWHGRDRFTLEVDDGRGRVAFEVPVVIAPANDAPTLRVRDVTTAEDTVVVTDAWPEDIDGDKLTLRVEQQGEKATATVTNKGVVRVTPAPDAVGKDTLVIVVDDGAATATAILTVTITPTPDAPRVDPGELVTAEDTPASVMLPGRDPDGDPLTFRLTNAGQRGVATLVDARSGRVEYAPAADAFGDDVIEFEVTDGVDDRRHRVVGRVAVTVRPVDDAPVVAPLAIEATEDAVARGTAVTTDVDGDATVLGLVSQPAHGTARVDDAAGGTVVFEPAKDFHGETSFVVAATETASGRLTSAPQTVVVKVAPVNDAPTTRGSATKTDEDRPVAGALVGNDIDGDALRWTVSRPPSSGTVAMDEKTGAYTYTPRKNTHGPDAFIFTVDDGAGGTASARVDVVIAPVDDAPAAIPVDLISPRSGRVTGRLLGRDPEGDALSYRIVSDPTLGKVKMLDDKNGDFAFSVEGAPKGKVVTFRFVVDAGGKTSEPEQVRIRIE
jgi:hypothetical protein